MNYHLILTLDYELFGNGSGCLDKCLTEPTDRLISLLEDYNAPCAFFVDALELKAISELRAPPSSLSPETFEQQLSAIGTSAHAIQLHLHPQWLDARYESGKWLLNNQLWRIGNLDSGTVDTVVSEGLAYLKKYTTKPITVFRAGGWAIQPSEVVLNSLRAHGITVDSTVAPGARNLAAGDWYNFLDSPERPYWRVSGDVCREDSAGETWEIPIATAQIGHTSRIKSLREHRRYPQFPPDCHGSYDGPNNRLETYLGKFSKLLMLGHAMLDFSTLPAWAMIEVTERYMQRFQHLQTAVPIVAIGHNKNFSLRSGQNLTEFLEWVARNDAITCSTYDQYIAVLNKQTADKT